MVYTFEIFKTVDKYFQKHLAAEKTIKEIFKTITKNLAHTHDFTISNYVKSLWTFFLR